MAQLSAPDRATVRQLKRHVTVWRIARWFGLVLGIVSLAAGAYGLVHSRIILDSVGNWRSGGPTISLIAHMLGITSVLGVLVLLMGASMLLWVGSRWQGDPVVLYLLALHEEGASDGSG